MSGYAPAATAAWMAEPRAGPWSERTTLRGRRVTSAYICIRSAFLTSPPATTSSSTGTPSLLEGLDDGPRPEGGGLQQRAVDVLGPGVQGQAGDHAAQMVVDQDRAVAVVPVEGDQPVRADGLTRQPDPSGIRAGSRRGPRGLERTTRERSFRGTRRRCLPRRSAPPRSPRARAGRRRGRPRTCPALPRARRCS